MRAALPRRLEGELTTSGKTGHVSIELGEGHFRTLAELAGMSFGAGTDDLGPWELPMQGVVVRRRPAELALGFSIFAAAVVRVDYAKSEVVFAKNDEAMHSARTVSLPITLWGAKPMVALVLDGKPASIELDTGNNGGVSLYARWASANGFPGERRTATVRGHFGAGAEETTATWFRLGKAELGPIVAEDIVVDSSDPPSGPRNAGLLGNEILSRCAAVVFDVPGRKLWLEPPCNRPVPERLARWMLHYRPDDAHKGRPWVVASTVAGGSAERAGIMAGDRLLSVGGKAAKPNQMSFADVLAKPPGTRVDMEVVRDGKPRHITLQLVKFP